MSENWKHLQQHNIPGLRKVFSRVLVDSRPYQSLLFPQKQFPQNQLTESSRLQVLIVLQLHKVFSQVSSDSKPLQSMSLLFLHQLFPQNQLTESSQLQVLVVVELHKVLSRALSDSKLPRLKPLVRQQVFHQKQPISLL